MLANHLTTPSETESDRRSEPDPKTDSHVRTDVLTEKLLTLGACTYVEQRAQGGSPITAHRDQIQATHTTRAELSTGPSTSRPSFNHRPRRTQSTEDHAMRQPLRCRIGRHHWYPFSLEPHPPRAWYRRCWRCRTVQFDTWEP